MPIVESYLMLLLFYHLNMLMPLQLSVYDLAQADYLCVIIFSMKCCSLI